MVVIDNKNQNPDKLSFLMDTSNKNIQINFLANARIDHLKHLELPKRDEQPNVDWRNGHENELVIYLNDVFGFKPDQITITKLGDGPQKPNQPLPQNQITRLVNQLNQALQSGKKEDLVRALNQVKTLIHSNDSSELKTA